MKMLNSILSSFEGATFEITLSGTLKGNWISFITITGAVVLGVTTVLSFF